MAEQRREKTVSHVEFMMTEQVEREKKGERHCPLLHRLQSKPAVRKAEVMLGMRKVTPCSRAGLDANQLASTSVEEKGAV